MNIVKEIVNVAKNGGWLREDFFKLVTFESYIRVNKTTLTISIVGLKAYDEPLRNNDETEIEKLNNFLIKSLTTKIPELKNCKIKIDTKTAY